MGFEWPFSLSHWAVLQLLLSLVSARFPKFSKHQLIGRIWRRKLYFSTGELGFCENLQVIWCWLQVCKEDPEGEEGEVEGGGNVEGKRTFVVPQHFWPQYSLDLSHCFPPQTSLLQDIKLSVAWEETAGIIEGAGTALISGFAGFLVAVQRLCLPIPWPGCWCSSLISPSLGAGSFSGIFAIQLFGGMKTYFVFLAHLDRIPSL